jgi:glycolate oxidase
VALAAADVERVCRSHGALHVEQATEESERARLWKGRKGAFGAMGRISTDLLVMDGVVPRHKLQWILAQIERIRAKHGVRLSNVFHAGDGNLHPNISYDGRNAEERERVLRAGEEILWNCVAAGGTLTGEHGVGVEKRDVLGFLFDDADIALMARVRDAWNPHGLCNPGKVLPTAKACIEARGRMLTFEEPVP